MSVTRRGRAHVVNEHQICGVILYALYMVQMSLGIIVHLRRPRMGTGKVHPPRNVVHIALGLVILGFAFFQTKTGITRDWELSSTAVLVSTILWICWVVIIPISYLAGLKLLRRQFDQERLGWHISTSQSPRPPFSLSDLFNRDLDRRVYRHQRRDHPSTITHGSSSDGGGSTRRILEVVVPPVGDAEASEAFDDGTHDVFSDNRRRRDSSPDPNATEMRELERPVPIIASIPGSGSDPSPA